MGLNLVVRWSFDVIVWSRFSCSLWVVCCVRCVVLVCSFGVVMASLGLYCWYIQVN